MAIKNGTIEDDLISGTNSADVIFSGSGNDTANGGKGNDIIFGDDGNDTLSGGAGDDDLIGGNGADLLKGGKGDDNLFGGNGADVLFGGKGDDSLFGGNGADILSGGKGDDHLTGGAGSDRFVISGGGNDVVEDFKVGVDIMDFAGADGDIGGITFTVINANKVIATGPGIPGGTVTIKGAGVGTPAGISYLQESSAVCFYPGTLVSTPEGARAIETLAIGDLVLTNDGRSLPVRWLGKQTVSRLFGDALRILPIRIKAGALGDNTPARDLLVSPSHALLIEDTLVHAGALVNGTSIVREHDVPMVFSYFNIELSEHALILAEGAAAETFVDNVERESFDNWEEHERLYGQLAPLVEMSLPRARSHRQVPVAVRRKLADRVDALGLSASQVA